ncbi:MAG: hypothetical protein RLZZ165_798 [Bacteroidota bacterium]|jgi:hypothetical protein
MRSTFKVFLGALVVSAAVIAAGCGSSATERKALEERAEARKVPNIAWKDVNFRDTVQVGDTIRRDFIFYSTGWKPVLVKHAIPDHPDCTCQVPQREVPVGEQDTVKLTCIFKDHQPKAPVNIIIEHNTPQAEQLLIFVAHMVEE